MLFKQTESILGTGAGKDLIVLHHCHVNSGEVKALTSFALTVCVCLHVCVCVSNPVCRFVWMQVCICACRYTLHMYAFGGCGWELGCKK